MRTADRTVVVFRVWRAGHGARTVFALFPELPADTSGRLCTSYAHVGQHGAADYNHCIASSRPASRDEMQPLKQELEQIGYRLDVRCRRASWRHRRNTNQEQTP